MAWFQITTSNGGGLDRHQLFKFSLVLTKYSGTAVQVQLAMMWALAVGLTVWHKLAEQLQLELEIIQGLGLAPEPTSFPWMGPCLG